MIAFQIFRGIYYLVCVLTLIWLVDLLIFSIKLHKVVAGVSITAILFILGIAVVSPVIFSEPYLGSVYALLIAVPVLPSISLMITAGNCNIHDSQDKNKWGIGFTKTLISLSVLVVIGIATTISGSSMIKKDYIKAMESNKFNSFLIYSVDWESTRLGDHEIYIKYYDKKNHIREYTTRSNRAVRYPSYGSIDPNDYFKSDKCAVVYNEADKLRIYYHHLDKTGAIKGRVILQFSDTRFNDVFKFK